MIKCFKALAFSTNYYFIFKYEKNSFATNTFFNNNILQNEMTVSILFF